MQVAVPRIINVDVPCTGNQWHYITPLSDLHMESAAFPTDDFLALMHTRNKEHISHRAFIIGDVADLVVPVDTKRFRMSVSRQSTRDDWANEAVEVITKEILAANTKIDMVSPGNHEDEFLKRHGTDITSMIAYALRAQRGAYSGYIRYRLKDPSGRVLGEPFTIAYHHGAWGGRVIKGFSGARDWFRGFQGWHMALFGHNHQVTALPERHQRITPKGRLVSYKAFYVNTGSWPESWDIEDGRNTHYAERAGFMPTLQTTPLIRFGAFKRNAKWELDYGVEV